MSIKFDNQLIVQWLFYRNLKTSEGSNHCRKNRLRMVSQHDRFLDKELQSVSGGFYTIGADNKLLVLQ